MPVRTVFRSLADVGIAGNACLKRIISTLNATDAAVIRAFAGIPELLEQAPALILRSHFDHPFHVSGASVTIMEQLGHFPMSENPEQFRRYLAPVLGRILKQSTFTKQGEHA
jgi:pimeloyl-ACP methyl ester carboxylesterase